MEHQIDCYRGIPALCITFWYPWISLQDVFWNLSSFTDWEEKPCELSCSRNYRQSIGSILTINFFFSWNYGLRDNGKISEIRENSEWADPFGYWIRSCQIYPSSLPSQHWSEIHQRKGFDARHFDLSSVWEPSASSIEGFAGCENPLQAFGQTSYSKVNIPSLHGYFVPFQDYVPWRASQLFALPR